MLVKCITWLKFFYFCVFNSLECLLLLFWSCSLFPFITYYYTTSFSFFSRCFKVNFSREFYLIHLHTSYTESTTCKSDSFRKEKRDENKKKQKKLSDFHNDDVLVLYDERLLFQTNCYMPCKKCQKSCFPSTSGKFEDEFYFN